MSDTTFEALVQEAELEKTSKLGQKGTVDPSVLKEFPNGAKIVDAIYHGISFWTKSLKVQVDIPEEGIRTYFLKLSSAPEAKVMMSGEYESQLLLNSYAEEFIPRPIAWGECTEEQTYFFLSDFIQMTDHIPEPVKFCARLAELHRKSMDRKNTEKYASDNKDNQFGLDKARCQGNVILNAFQSSSWCEYFQHAMEDMIVQEKATQGYCAELEKYKSPLIHKIIPRLLNPLQAGGNNIQPCLVHGDLWHGNASVSALTGEPHAFDSCAIWGHNEYEMDIWRASRYSFKQQYFQEYHRWIPISQPEEDWDMRNILYAVRVDLLCSALYRMNRTFRQLALEGIQTLIERLGPEYAVEDEDVVLGHEWK